MLVGFIGAPCSGKTTTAAKLFAELKESGQPAEYIAEKARSYIANKKFMLRQEGIEDSFSLTDQDQVAIAKTQFRAELVMNQGDLIVVTDSCVLNSLLYMSEATRQSLEVKDLVRAATSKYDLLFVAGPVQRPSVTDPNRVHDEEESLLINSQIATVLQPEFEGKHVIYLSGPMHVRLQEALSTTLNKFYSRS